MVERYLREIDRLENEFTEQAPQEILDQIDCPFPSAFWVHLFLDMSWHVLVTGGPQFFITSDNPVFWKWAEGHGLGQPHSEFALPLSSTHALHGSWRGPRRGLVLEHPARQKWVREINKWTASHADRFAYYHKPASWLTDLLSREKLNLWLLGL